MSQALTDVGRLSHARAIDSPIDNIACVQLGFKFGIYSAAGLTTCMSRAGSLYHETVDAQAYADWYGQ